MLILLLLMLLLSLKCVRDKHYDLFWATHLLFLPFICLLMIHPLRLVCITLLIFIRLIKVSFLKALLSTLVLLSIRIWLVLIHICQNKSQTRTKAIQSRGMLKLCLLKIYFSQMCFYIILVLLLKPFAKVISGATECSWSFIASCNP